MVVILGTVFFASIIFQHYNASSSIADFIYYINVADNLRDGNGFVLDIVDSGWEYNSKTGQASRNYDPDIIINEYPGIFSEYSMVNRCIYNPVVF